MKRMGSIARGGMIDRRVMKLRRTDNHHPVRVTLYDLGTHIDQAVDEIHAAFKQLFKNRVGVRMIEQKLGGVKNGRSTA